MFSRAPLSIWPRWCGVYGELSHEQQATVAAAAGRTIAWQMALFYFASGFWKLNSSFLDPSTSCATVYFAGLLAGYALPALVGPALLQLVRAAAPAATVALELLLGLLQGATDRGFRGLA